MFGTGYNDHRAQLGYSVRTQAEVDQAFYGRAQWREQFAWWPHRCAISGRWCWMNFHYQGQAVWTGPGDDAVEVRWHDCHEHLIWTLKGPHG